MIIKKFVAALLVVASVTGCSGVRTSPAGTFTTHAESFRVLGYAIPGDDKARAHELIPAGSTIHTIESTPADWTSVVGVIGNLFWINGTRISGTVTK